MKLNKKQLKAVDTLIVFIDELDNKPRRLFQGLREFADAFIDNNHPDKKRIIGSIGEFEDYYYLFKNIPEIIREVAQTTIDTKRELMEQEYYLEQDEMSIYERGVDDCRNLMAKKVISDIIDFNN